MGLELENLGRLASETDRNQVGKQADRKVRQNNEDHLSAAFNYWLDLPEIQLRGAGFHVGNERSSKAEAGRLKWVGVKPGVADFIFTGPPVTAVELKYGDGRQSPVQKVWGEVFTDGWAGYIDPDECGEGWDGSGMSIETLKDLFAPRYYICRTLASAADVLHARGLLRAPATREAIEASVTTVLRWWLVKYRMELE